MKEVTSTFFANDAPDHYPNDWDDWLVYTSNDMNCPGCTETSYVDNDGDFLCGASNGVQFSGVYAGEKGGNDAEELKPNIIDAVFDSEHGVTIEPGVYHQSAITNVIEKGLDSISIPRGVRLRIFEEGPSSPVMLSITGPAVIQNTLNHPLHSRVPDYTMPLNAGGTACMLELRSCDLAESVENLDANMYLWFGDCAPRRWFEVGCACKDCPPKSEIVKDYGKNICIEPAAIQQCEQSSRSFNNCPDWDAEATYCRSATSEGCYEAHEEDNTHICECDVVKYDGHIWAFDHGSHEYGIQIDCAQKGQAPGTDGTGVWVKVDNHTTGETENGLFTRNCCSPCEFGNCGMWATSTAYALGDRVY